MKHIKCIEYHRNSAKKTETENLMDLISNALTRYFSAYFHFFTQLSRDFVRIKKKNWRYLLVDFFFYRRSNQTYHAKKLDAFLESCYEAYFLQIIDSGNSYDEHFQPQLLIHDSALAFSMDLKIHVNVLSCLSRSHIYYNGCLSVDQNC